MLGQRHDHEAVLLHDGIALRRDALEEVPRDGRVAAAVWQGLDEVDIGIGALGTLVEALQPERHGRCCLCREE